MTIVGEVGVGFGGGRGERQTGLQCKRELRPSSPTAWKRPEAANPFANHITGDLPDFGSFTMLVQNSLDLTMSSVCATILAKLLRKSATVT